MRDRFVPPAPGISIAFFMLLAAMVTPQAPAGGVGLRAGLASRVSAPAALTPSSAAARERSVLPSGGCPAQAGTSSADAARGQAE
jgi:hypothetical protein